MKLNNNETIFIYVSLDGVAVAGEAEVLHVAAEADSVAAEALRACGYQVSCPDPTVMKVIISIST